MNIIPGTRLLPCDNAEHWLPVHVFSGLYEVSDHGRVRSLDRIDANGRHRKELLTFSVNIGAPPPQELTTTIPLSKYLETPCLEVPAWAVGRDLYFDPGSDREQLERGVVKYQRETGVRCY